MGLITSNGFINVGNSFPLSGPLICQSEDRSLEKLSPCLVYSKFILNISRSSVLGYHSKATEYA